MKGHSTFKTVDFFNDSITFFKLKGLFYKTLRICYGHHDTQQNDTQHNDIQRNGTQHNDTQHKNKRNATLSIIALQCYLCCVLLCWLSFMLSVENKPIMQSVVILSVVMPL
jgi:hypothetical protein